MHDPHHSHNAGAPVAPAAVPPAQTETEEITLDDGSTWRIQIYHPTRLLREVDKPNYRLDATLANLNHAHIATDRDIRYPRWKKRTTTLAQVPAIIGRCTHA